MLVCINYNQYLAAAACSDVSYRLSFCHAIQQYAGGLVLLLWIWGVMDFLPWRINCLHHFP